MHIMIVLLLHMFAACIHVMRTHVAGCCFSNMMLLLAHTALCCVAEAIRESDIAKLSFAVQLAEGLFSRQQQHEHQQQQGDNTSTSSSRTSRTDSGAAAKNHDGHADEDGSNMLLHGSFQPGSMLWLIQRDFLQGAGAQQAVEEALAVVPNPQV